ncbi:hypothetical protein, partial [Roseobacter sp. HKCCA0434]|uniref:hypothetical protein n=1 Tax=Roseobacter sp. HKCCA0434 TaxID=3079297 RepID=UPI002905AD42
MALAALAPMGEARPVAPGRGIAAGAVAAALGIGLLALGTLYHWYGAGLPAAADPWRDRRADGAMCEEVLFALEDAGAGALAAPDRALLLPCAWRGGLPALPVVSLDLPDDAALAVRRLQGPLALEGPAVVLLPWPMRAEDALRDFARVERLGAYGVPDHAGGERRFSLHLVEGWQQR